MPEANYDERQVPPYSLPDPLVSNDGSRVTEYAQWLESRRSEILELFCKQVYGKTPADNHVTTIHVVETEPAALGGIATRKQITMRFERAGQALEMDILVYLPNTRRQPAPLFTALNFCGNQSIHSDPGIRLARTWIANDVAGVENNRATETSRGTKATRWAVEAILKRGYALATVYCGDLDPDYDDGFENGLHRLYPDREQNNWGAIGAWAWGLSRIVDYCEQDPDIDNRRVAVMGHSRLGKTALWAGAQDRRFALVISNNSGCGGAALSRRRFGETVAAINSRFPHWFGREFKEYNGREDELPVDQHMLLALIAPRPLYVASAAEDGWADPRGEYLSAYHAAPVYRLAGKSGPTEITMPDLHRPIMETVGYHLRAGGHDVTDYDWARYLDFADIHLRR